MRYLVLCVIGLGSAASAEQHLAEIYAGILACEDRQCVGEGASLCMELREGGDTTVGITRCLADEATVWDDLLNEAYGQAMSFARALDDEDAAVFPEYAIRANQLRDAQRAWIAYRDAKCAAEYAMWGAGTMRQIAAAGCQLQTTAERTFELRHLLDMY